MIFKTNKFCEYDNKTFDKYKPDGSYGLIGQAKLNALG